MLTSRELIAAVRDAQDIQSNYRLARFLDVPEKNVQRWNTGKNTPDDVMAVRLAELANLDPAEVLTAMYAQRAADGPLSGVWKGIAERLAAHAHVAVFAMGAAILSWCFSGGPDGGASMLAGLSAVFLPLADNNHCQHFVWSLVDAGLILFLCQSVSKWRDLVPFFPVPRMANL